MLDMLNFAMSAFRKAVDQSEPIQEVQRLYIPAYEEELQSIKENGISEDAIIYPEIRDCSLFSDKSILTPPCYKFDLVKPRVEIQPSKIEEYLKDLIKTGKLEDDVILSKAEIQFVKKAYAKEKQVKITKSNKQLSDSIVLRHSVIQDTHGVLYAILGKSQSISLSDEQGIIKIAQNLDTGEFCLVKIIRIKDLKQELYRKNQAELEVKHLKQLGVLNGYQFRQNPSEIFEYKCYIFMKILPGIQVGSAITAGIFKLFSSFEQCEFLLNVLLALDKLKQESIIHRDLHGRNVLFVPETMRINFVDFGWAVKSDKSGFWYGKSVQDIDGKGPTIRFANGIDILDVYNNIILSAVSDEKLLKISRVLKKAAYQTNRQGDDEYNCVDITPFIKEVREYQTQLIQNHRASRFRFPFFPGL